MISEPEDKNPTTRPIYSNLYPDIYLVSERFRDRMRHSDTPEARRGGKPGHASPSRNTPTASGGGAGVVVSRGVTNTTDDNNHQRSASNTKESGEDRQADRVLRMRTPSPGSSFSESVFLEELEAANAQFQASQRARKYMTINRNEPANHTPNYPQQRPDASSSKSRLVDPGSDNDEGSDSDVPVDPVLLKWCEGKKNLGLRDLLPRTANYPPELLRKFSRPVAPAPRRSCAPTRNNAKSQDNRVSTTTAVEEEQPGSPATSDQSQRYLPRSRNEPAKVTDQFVPGPIHPHTIFTSTPPEGMECNGDGVTEQHGISVTGSFSAVSPIPTVRSRAQPDVGTINQKPAASQTRKKTGSTRVSDREGSGDPDDKVGDEPKELDQDLPVVHQISSLPATRSNTASGTTHPPPDRVISSRDHNESSRTGQLLVPIGPKRSLTNPHAHPDTTSIRASKPSEQNRIGQERVPPHSIRPDDSHSSSGHLHDTSSSAQGDDANASEEHGIFEDSNVPDEDEPVVDAPHVDPPRPGSAASKRVIGEGSGGGARAQQLLETGRRQRRRRRRRRVLSSCSEHETPQVHTTSTRTPSSTRGPESEQHPVVVDVAAGSKNTNPNPQKKPITKKPVTSEKTRSKAAPTNGASGSKRVSQNGGSGDELAEDDRSVGNEVLPPPSPPVSRSKTLSTKKRPPPRVISPSSSDNDNNDAEADANDPEEQVPGPSGAGGKKRVRNPTTVSRSRPEPSGTRRIKKAVGKPRFRYTGTSVWGNYNMIKSVDEFRTLLDQAVPWHGLDADTVSKLHRVTNHFLEDFFEYLCDNTDQYHGFFTFHHLKALLINQKLIDKDTTDVGLMVMMRDLVPRGVWRKCEGIVYPHRNSEPGEGTSKYLWREY